ncbi:MAG TPA: alpha/beta hydrolase [Lacisediminihabitans sp.]|nr:alpha/beta hydrolase [Lacisediminihabitans sp.]HXD60829.1 alpha/beta hydrolase [Lacisediminihabitans sp.]
MNVARWSLVWTLDHVYAARVQLRYLADGSVPQAYLDGDAPPVLLLPGVYENWQFLKPVGELLNSLGHPVHVVRELGYNRQPIADSAELATRILIERDLRHVVIVGHSKGGLIGKQLMVKDAVAGRIDRMVAINSPFSGSRLARYAPGAPLRAFLPSNETIATLAQNLEANSRITSIFSSFDPVIPEGSRLDAAENVELPLSGHFRPLGSRELLDAVRRAVERGASAGGSAGPE